MRVPFNQARYGRNTCGDIVCPATRALVRDALAFWVDGQLRSGRTLQQVSDHLRTFDVQDRYDADGDGVFAEPDGFLDRFQVVHAGGDEASGDPVYGEDAIWSHRSYAFVQTGGPGGLPGVDVGSGGVDAGQTIPHHPTGVWVGDYTMQPENGGLGIVAHEYGHDLGLPDLYDTSGNTGGAENSTAFWSLMSSGSNLGDGSPDGVGDAPVDLGTWEKLQLGWLDYEVAYAGQRSTHRLAPSTSQTRQAQAVITVLPDKLVPVELGAPCATCGSRYFTSGSGDDRTATMQRAVPQGSRSLTAQVRHDVEQDWDYAFLEASRDGTTWTPVTTTLSDGADDQSGLNASRTGLTGTRTSWTALSATLPRRHDGDPLPQPAPTAPTRCPASRSTASRSTAGRSAPPRPTRAGRSTASRRPRAPGSRRSRTTTSRRTGSTSATTPRCGRRTTSASAAPPAVPRSSRPTRTRTACSSTTGTPRRPTTTWGSTPARAWSCRSTPTRCSSTPPTATCCARAS